MEPSGLEAHPLTLEAQAPVEKWLRVRRGARKERKERFHNITSEDLWNLHKVSSNKKGSHSQTKRKNTEANAKVYDL